jgi:hypothetical protein
MVIQAYVDRYLILGIFGGAATSCSHKVSWAASATCSCKHLKKKKNARTEVQYNHISCTLARQDNGKRIGDQASSLEKTRESATPWGVGKIFLL